mmetsp:Transcript_37378/g.116407  ORF Transcript_37378/g.116407 Transcript_37378/m.116407 type:complete len:229 (-) Transcript_37378:171-857(-)
MVMFHLIVACLLRGRDAAEMRVCARNHVESFGILRDDAAAAAERARAAHDAVPLLAAEALVQVRARVRAPERAAREEGHEQEAEPVVHHARGVEGVRRARPRAAERQDAVRRARLQRGHHLVLLLQGDGRLRGRGALEHGILGDDDAVVQQAEEELQEDTGRPRASRRHLALVGLLRLALVGLPRDGASNLGGETHQLSRRACDAAGTGGALRGIRAGAVAAGSPRSP